MYYYTGVGSRTTPQDKLTLMDDIAIKMAKFNYTLRSGGADGADRAFEHGAITALLDQNEEAMLDSSVSMTIAPPAIFLAKHCTPEAEAIAGQFHPAWNRCSPYAKKLHGRNAFQILGINLNEPSQYCICWTPDGCISHATRTIKTGGTGTAISIADHYNVPIINLARPDQCQMWTEWAYTA